MDKELSVLVKSSHDNMMVTCDGQQGTPLLEGDEIKVKRSVKPVYLMLSKNFSYFDVLREKLHWGGKR